jgi:hypothetical protein
MKNERLWDSFVPRDAKKTVYGQQQILEWDKA